MIGISSLLSLYAKTGGVNPSPAVDPMPWTEMEPSHQVRDNAARVLLLHPLRAADSLQLAAALVWANQKGMGHEFVCLDKRLRSAAQREGFSVLPRHVDVPKSR